MKNKILFSTNNLNKLGESRLILNDYEVVGLNSFNKNIIEPEETGDTYEENAKIKAKYYYDLFKTPCFSDDSGLEVSYLGGIPGVHSKRYYTGSDVDKTKQLLSSLDGVINRKARYVCAICFTTDGINFQFFKGILEGVITDNLYGSNGFGYDPIFVPNGYKETLGELPNEIKNKISHRYNALILFKEYLNENISSI